MFKAAILLSNQYNITIEGQLIEWQLGQTGDSLIDGLSSTCQAISTSNIVGIVGPESSRDVPIIAGLAKAIGIPVISNAATDPDLSDRNAYPAFYRTVPSDNAAALSIVKLFTRFNWTSCVIIYQNDAYGSGGVKAISDAFLDNSFIVTNLIVFDIATLSIQGNLSSSLMNSASRIVFVWATSSYTTLILQNALDSGVLGPYFTWILSSSVVLNSFNQTFSQNLIGMLTIEPVTAAVVDAPINETLLDAAYRIWQQYEPESFPGPSNVSFYALFAFDATWTLIQALQQLCSQITNSSSSCISFAGPTSCFDRRFINADLFYNAVTTTAFLGVSGSIKFNVNVTDRINGTYYYIQNAQSFTGGVRFVPVLEYADPGDWNPSTEANLIMWPNSSSTPPADRAILSGVTLRIGVIESPPFTIVTNVSNGLGQSTITLTGYVPDLIELLRTKLGFIPNIELAPSSLTYDQFVAAVANGVYDIAVGDVTVTSTRRETVGFSSSIFDNSLRIIMRATPDVTVDLLAFLEPFTRNLWLLILGSMVFAGILLCVIERHTNQDLQNRPIISAGGMSVWYSFGNMMGYGVEFNVSTAAGRILTAGLYMLSLVLVASYTANLASDLTILKSQSVISGIDDIKNGKIPFSRIGIRVGTTAEDYYLDEISGGNKNYYPLYSRQQLYDSLLNGTIDASFTDIGVGEYVTNTIYCNLTLVGADFDQGAFGIVTPKQWLYAQELDVVILALGESNDLNDLRAKWFQTQNCPDSSGTSTAMGVESLEGLFLIFAVITVLALLVFVWNKRCIIKNYVARLVGRTDWLSKKKHSILENGNNTSSQPQNLQSVSCTVQHF